MSKLTRIQQSQTVMDSRQRKHIFGLPDEYPKEFRFYNESGYLVGIIFSEDYGLQPLTNPKPLNTKEKKRGKVSSRKTPSRTKHKSSCNRGSKEKAVRKSRSK